MGRLYDGRRDRPVAWWQICRCSALILGLCSPVALWDPPRRELASETDPILKTLPSRLDYVPAPDFSFPFGPCDESSRAGSTDMSRLTVLLGPPKGNRLVKIFSYSNLRRPGISFPGTGPFLLSAQRPIGRKVALFHTPAHSAKRALSDTLPRC